MSKLPDNINKITDHLFRREAGKMVAVLTRIFGAENLEIAEDVIQETFLLAFKVWVQKGIPDNPSAWLFSVARNKALNIIKRNKLSGSFNFTRKEIQSASSPFLLIDNFYQEELIKDDMLRMMFACCHPRISKENQVTVILKTLCGFSTAEIAKAFFTSEDTISKRLYRTKEYFRENKVKLIIPSADEINDRIDAVLQSIYLLFNEGYNSTNTEELIRQDLIDEAMLLCKLLIENKHTQHPETYALMALMCFHSSRSKSRLTTEGEIILLKFQDRTLWNLELIAQGNEYMNKAAVGNAISNFHIEAAIAFEHCTAMSFEQTNWKRIIDLYDWLCKISPSYITELNRAVAILQFSGADDALTAIKNIAVKEKLETFYLYHALLGEVYSRLGYIPQAKESFEKAMLLTQSGKEKKLLSVKLVAL